MRELAEQEIVRREKLEEIKKIINQYFDLISLKSVVDTCESRWCRYRLQSHPNLRFGDVRPPAVHGSNHAWIIGNKHERSARTSSVPHLQAEFGQLWWHLDNAAI